ncbi:MAG: molybdenum ABC transporter ATP-binding protein [Burkholderiales bacterium]|nr:molybdenum ABC transporter ATP-binding protein [Burkholderiales bacterium]
MSSPQSSGTPLEMRVQLQRAGFALHMDVQLPPQGVSVLFGPSGCGKTTCLRVLAGLERGATGQIRVAGEVWQDSASGVFRAPHLRALGYVFQEASLFDHLSVQDNLMFGFHRTPADQRRHAWDQSLDLLGIAHLLQRMPYELSGGERQRVAIARALASSPQVLLMDEPLAALDAQRKAEILPWLEQLHAQLDIPVLYVTHSPDELARLADQVVLMEDGRVRECGPVIELMARLDLPLAHGDGAAALIAARICDHTPSDLMCVLEFDGGRLVLPQTRTTPLPTGTPVRIRIQARDVSVSLQKPEQTSVLNILPATVVDMVDDGPGQVLVGLQVGNAGQGTTAKTTRLLSRISQLSARRLRLAPGVALYAQIKGVAMVR